VFRLRLLTGIAVAGAALVLPRVASAASSSPWVPQALPQPNNYGLAAVSCPTSASCIALGGPWPSNAVGWNGTTWTATTLPLPRSTDAALTSVSCPAATSCTAVGDWTTSQDTEFHVFADQLSGGTWTLRRLPLRATVAENFGALGSVSCASATSCTAVGYFQAEDTTAIPLAEMWNGSTWTARYPPLPRTAGDAYLQAVSCATVSSCTAVGYYDPTPSAEAVGLAEQWNGTAWSFQRVPIAARSGSGQPGKLLGISCPAAGGCTAVGEDFTGTVNPVSHQVAERYSGGTWTYQGVPGPRSETGGGLESVSCVGTACTATGTYTKPLVGHLQPTDTLAEVTTGGAWSYQATVPLPKYYHGGDLPSVSCTAAATCTAVGVVTQPGPGGGALPVAERK
jgi:hypothetical protein